MNHSNSSICPPSSFIGSKSSLPFCPCLFWGQFCNCQLFLPVLMFFFCMWHCLCKSMAKSSAKTISSSWSKRVHWIPFLLLLILSFMIQSIAYKNKQSERIQRRHTHVMTGNFSCFDVYCWWFLHISWVCRSASWCSKVLRRSKRIQYDWRTVGLRIWTDSSTTFRENGNNWYGLTRYNRVITRLNTDG